MLITAEQLKKVATTLSKERAKVMADLLNEICQKYGIDTKDEFHEFAANVIQESGEFSHKSENMNYSAQRMAEVWPGTFSLTKKPPYKPNQLALSLHKKPKELANYKYGSLYGNKKGTDDGWNYRGAGFIGLTFKDTFQKYANHIGKSVEETANLVRTTDYYALDSAAWFFSVLKGLNDEAERDEWLKIVKSINGGYIGLNDRNKYYERLKLFMTS